ncbi:MFS transporter [Coxiella endosymbiont of Amblyomma nuttalli]|uniref:MFS transporter n=1 Tax=Coxiella endosymbiont of Amblyomma nuttalli TaxID=2749996 RepID=UPI001BA90F66|nr:MFS transporter [Coxiella endosymbiont of Amblyomma nuttalli]QTS84004.1 Multidrug resistance protein stp [Coxiella endosymbiont of Amblyomma nuttalli]
MKTDYNRKWWILVTMATALSLVFIDQTAVSIALPQIQRDLNTSNQILHWMINGYLLSLSTVVIFGGKLGDLFGYRYTFLVGTIVFVLASLACVVAESGTWIIVSRVIQGIGGAFMIPTTGVIVINAFPKEEHSRATGIYIGLASIALSIGPLLGGALTEFLSWRWVFGINLPVALLSIILMLKFVSKEKRTQIISIDWLGFILLAMCVACFILALMEVFDFGWTSPLIWTLLAISLLSVMAFIIVEQRLKHPLVELNIFRNRLFATIVMMLIIMRATFISFIFWMIFLQNVIGFSPGMVGLLVLPVTLPIILGSPFSSYLDDRFGPRLLISFGAAFVVASMLWVGITSWTHNYVYMFPGFLLLGFATPLVVSNSMMTGVTAIEAHQRGLGSGILRASRQLGSSIGLAIIGSVISHVNQTKISGWLSHATGLLAQIQSSQINGILAGTASSRQAVAHLSPQEMDAVHTVAVYAYTFAFSRGMYLAALIAFIGFLLALQIPRRQHVD